MIKDAMGQELMPAEGTFRIVSLVPSLTETLFDMGLEENLVGRTSFCIHPKDRIKKIQSVGGTKAINMRTLKRLKPTHVLVNVDENPRELAEEIAALGITVVATHPIEPSDNLDLFSLLGNLFGAQDAADRLCREFQNQLDSLREAACGMPERWVLYMIWQDPWMTVSPDTYIARMLALINWHTVGGQVGGRYPEIVLNDETLAGVDHILLSSEPFAFTKTHQEMLKKHLARRSVQISLIDGEMTSWYGSRAIQGLGYLRALIQ